MKREKLEIIYSVGILITIPVILIANTIILTQSMTGTFDLELRRKADLANSIIAQSSVSLIQDKQYDTLQNNLNKLESSQPSLMDSAIIARDNDQLTVVAHSTSASSELSPGAETEAKLAIDHKTSIASLVNTYDRQKNTAQAWYVMTPVMDETSKNVIAVVSTSFLTSDAREAIDGVYRQSFLVLVVSIVLILILLFRHFRLVSYVRLLAKQRELNQTMSDFLSVATHELKAPTTIIKGYLSNIIEGDFGSVTPKISEQIQVALSQTDRLNALVQDLLSVSRIEQGRIQYNISSVDITKTLDLIVKNYRPIAEDKGLKLIYDKPDDMPLIRADEGRAQEIFTNLIDNAIKYTGSGSVTISHKIDKGFVTTNIHDTGFGIGPDAKARLFQRFYRVQTSQTQSIPGNGLGLWIIKQYITAMDGSIDVETMQDVGSNFIVKLPADRADK